MTEEILYQKHIKPYLKKQGGFFYRVEHMRIPDIYVSKHGISVWVELKVINKIPTSGVLEPDWRPGQLAWIEELKWKGSGRAVLILWVVNKWYILPPKQTYRLEELDGGWSSIFV